jgi:hypothetical protein
MRAPDGFVSTRKKAFLVTVKRTLRALPSWTPMVPHIA